MHGRKAKHIEFVSDTESLCFQPSATSMAPDQSFGHIFTPNNTRDMRHIHRIIQRRINNHKTHNVRRTATALPNAQNKSNTSPASLFLFTA